MKIRYTRHAEKKFKDLEELGIKVNKRFVNGIIKKPIHVDEESDYPKKIASGELDESHILRVVYKKEDGIMTVVTFYPSRKGRYF